MIQICQESKEEVLRSIKAGQIDAADISRPNFIDRIILKMERLGVTNELSEIIEDKRKKNALIPLKFIWILGISAKMKIHTSLTDIPYAIMDADVLSKLGYALWDTERDLEKGLMDEGAIRHLLGKYESKELIAGYTKCVQERIMPKMDLEASIYLLVSKEFSRPGRKKA